MVDNLEDALKELEKRCREIEHLKAKIKEEEEIANITIDNLIKELDALKSWKYIFQGDLTSVSNELERTREERDVLIIEKGVLKESLKVIAYHSNSFPEGEKCRECIGNRAVALLALKDMEE